MSETEASIVFKDRSLFLLFVKTGKGENQLLYFFEAFNIVCLRSLKLVKLLFFRWLSS